MSLSSRLEKLENRNIDKANWMKVIYVARWTTKRQYDKMVEEARKAGARLIMTMPEPESDDEEEEEGPDYEEIITGKTLYK